MDDRAKRKELMRLSKERRLKLRAEDLIKSRKEAQAKAAATRAARQGHWKNEWADEDELRAKADAILFGDDDEEDEDDLLR